MTFELADIVANLPQRTPGGNNMKDSVVKNSALEILQVPLFLGS